MFNANNSAKCTDLLKTCSTKIYQFAILSNLIVRKSKTFKAEVFLLALMKVVQQGKSTLNKIVMEMAEIDSCCVISPQALHKRINREDCFLEKFFNLCVGLMISQGITETKKHSGKFCRILTEDSSFVKMLKSCSELFPAHGNRYGQTAGIKLNLIFDLLTGMPLEFSTHEATTQDKTIAHDIMALLKTGDLVLRDMGYFIVELFEKIENKGADWLSRVPASADIFTEDGHKIEQVMSQSKSGVIERQMYLTKEGKQARILAVKKSPEKANEAIRQLKESYKKNGKTPSKEKLERARWHLLATSVSQEVMTAQELTKLYSQRWQIEIIFKAWKGSTNLERSLNRKSSYQHLLGLFLAEVLRLSVGLCCFFKTRLELDKDTVARLSIMKLFDWISTRLNGSKSFKRLISGKFTKKHVLTQKRKRKSQLLMMLELLG